MEEFREKPRSPSKKLSFPLVEDRRRSVPRVGHYGRVVVCAVDTSVHSRDAFEWYLKNIWKADDLVVVVYFSEIPYLPSLSFKKGLSPPVEKWKEILDEANTKTSQLEEDYEQLCREKKITYKICVEGQTKNTGEGICKFADREKAQLIVMGTRGAGAIKRFFMGSVSEHVSRHSGVPYVIVPG